MVKKLKKEEISDDDEFHCEEESEDNNNDNSPETVQLADERKNYKFTPDQIEYLTTNLLTWYDASHRVLPWRKNPTNSHTATNNEESKYSTMDINQRAYQVWISEIMSQQTRIATVITYFENWMKAFPTVSDLANSNVETVHKVWSGLGYYRRADNIHKAAKKVVDDLDGKFPTTVNELLKLPGVGRYTAGAIASVVFNERAPIVDGNVLRLFSRLQKISVDISKQKNCNDHFWPLAEQLVDCNTVPATRIGDLNQSLMEMGAIVCTPKNPKCSDCCVKSQCSAYTSVLKGEAGSVEIWPVKSKKKQKAKRSVAVCVASRESDNGEEEYYIMKNPTQGLLANLYQFPCITIAEETDQKEAKSLLQKYLRQNTDLDVSAEEPLAMKYCGEVQHIFTHIDMQLKVFSAKLSSSTSLKTQANTETVSAFATESGFDQYGIPTVVRKVLQQYLHHQLNPFQSSASKSTSTSKTKKKSRVTRKKTTTTATTTSRKRKKGSDDENDDDFVAKSSDNTTTPTKKHCTRSQSKLTSFFKSN